MMRQAVAIAAILAGGMAMADMRLAVDGKSEYVIVLPQAPTPVE